MADALAAFVVFDFDELAPATAAHVVGFMVRVVGEANR